MKNIKPNEINLIDLALDGLLQYKYKFFFMYIYLIHL